MSLNHFSHDDSELEGSIAVSEHGILDLYARRMAVVAEAAQTETVQQLGQQVVTKPFGRPFTAQPSYPPDPAETPAGAMAELRRRLSPSPSRKLATS